MPPSLWTSMLVHRARRRASHSPAVTNTFSRQCRRHLLAACCFLLVAACGAVSASPTTKTPGSGSTVPTSSAESSPLVTTTTTSPVEQGWTPVSSLATGVAIDDRTVTTVNGAHMTIIRFRAGQVRFALHAGSQEPPTHGIALGPASQPAVGASERALLLGAFNGGFKVRDSSWGVEIDGNVLTPLVAGMASLVIDADGSAHVGVWGQTVPAPREVVTSVRQNLPPLVVDSLPSPSIAGVDVWGSPLHGVAFQARSGLGQDAAGNLIFAASMGALPADLASALLLAGATVAMELDINPQWVQADFAATPGGPLAAFIPGQTQPADRYLLGWTRDFVTVDAPG
jgi:hypothetical protein